MSWIRRLHETYENCAGREPEGAEPMMPICHTTQQAQIEIVLDSEGAFKRASVLAKGTGATMIPCTEASGGRAGAKPINHPLCDKLQYVAGDFLKFGGEVTSGFSSDPQEPYRTFLHDLVAWHESDSDQPKLTAILRYVEKGKLIADLVAEKVLPLDADGKLLKKWISDKDSSPAIFKAIQNTQTPAEAFVRWRVEQPGNPVSAIWQDSSLINGWIHYYLSTQVKRGYCMASGMDVSLAIQHPAKLRHAGDKAKLISSNDTSGFTFRGRFLDADQALSVGFDMTQKAHNALRWLIARQGYRNGDQAIVSWAVTGRPVPDPFDSTLELFGFAAAETDKSQVVADTAQTFALRLKRAIAGYGAKLDPNDDIVVMGIDSATPGRMAIIFYRELKGSEFLARIEAWHTQCAWPQYFGKDRKFEGAPAPRDIAEAAFGRRLDDKLSKATVERLLPCIVDGAAVPRDIVTSTTRRAANRTGFEQHWEWEKCLGIACALFKKQHLERNYQMSLEQDRTNRDYLYGRLLAIAENIEGRALYVSGEKNRDTMAGRLMQRFADHPYSTWRTIELSLAPYKTRLRAQRAGFLFGMEKQLDDVMSSFQGEDFTRNGTLSGEFLLGYHCQRQALRANGDTDVSREKVTADEAIEN
jgi:CRISPR-associated protein Csd1